MGSPLCESNAFLRRGETEELILKDVAVVEPLEGGFRLRSLFGDEIAVQGRIQELNFLNHKIVFCAD